MKIVCNSKVSKRKKEEKEEGNEEGRGRKEGRERGGRRGGKTHRDIPRAVDAKKTSLTSKGKRRE